MYMDVRIPLPINSNPGMVLPPRKFTTVHDVARFAAQVIDGIMKHKENIDRYKRSQRFNGRMVTIKVKFQRKIGKRALCI